MLWAKQSLERPRLGPSRTISNFWLAVLSTVHVWTFGATGRKLPGASFGWPLLQELTGLGNRREFGNMMQHVTVVLQSFAKHCIVYTHLYTVFLRIQTYSDVFSRIQMYSDAFRRIKTYSDVFRCIPTSSDEFRGFQTYSDVFRRIQMYVDVFRCI